MTEYGEQVADLTEDAFKNLREAARTSPDAPAVAQRIHAQAQLAAAQAIATLGLANEVRAVALILATMNHADAEPSAAIAREAFTAAAIHLGLVEEDVQTTGLDEDALYGPGTDPADKDVEL